jgi:hypothetical protein
MNRKATYQNLWDTEKAVLRRKFVAASTFFLPFLSLLLFSPRHVDFSLFLCSKCVPKGPCTYYTQALL